MEIKYECPLGMNCEKGSSDGETLIRCMFYMKVAGQDPQTGEEFDRWQCAMTLTPVLLIENSNMIRGLQAATESFRNENDKAAIAIVGSMQRLGDIAAIKKLK